MKFIVGTQSKCDDYTAIWYRFKVVKYEQIPLLITSRCVYGNQLHRDDGFCYILAVLERITAAKWGNRNKKRRIGVCVEVSKN